MATFDLVEERWLPCVRADGAPGSYGLRDVLVRAHELRGLADPSPLVTVALHRLLLAILHRNLGPATMREWTVLWRRGRWDEETLGAYLERWRRWFDLFDPERPFYQVMAMPEVGERPVAALAPERASGNNAVLFDHSVDASPEPLEPAAAARGLLACQAYAIGIGMSTPFYLKDAHLTRGYSVLPEGTTLFETLMLNLLAYNEDRPLPRHGADLPCWEQESPPEPDPDGTVPRGYLDYLTWRSRRIHLIPEGDPTVVRRCQIQQNLKLAPGVLDPFKCYRRDEARGYSPLNLRPARAVWRDSHALLQETDPGYKRPGVFDWLARIDAERRNGTIAAAPAYGYGLVGMATEEGKAGSVILWRRERLPLPLAYLRDETLSGALRAALAFAEGAKGVLNGSVHRLAELCLSPASDGDGRKPPRAAAADLAGSFGAERAYWSRLDAPFRRLLVDLERDRDADPDYPEDVTYGATALPRWAETVSDAARRSLREVTRSLAGSARTLKAAARAEGYFERELRRLREGTGFAGIRAPEGVADGGAGYGAPDAAPPTSGMGGER